MKSEKKLREFLQERFDNEEFPYSAAGWKSARNYVDARRRSARRRSIGAGLAVIIFLSLGSWWLTMETPARESGLASAEPVNGSPAHQRMQRTRPVSINEGGTSALNKEHGIVAAENAPVAFIRTSETTARLRTSMNAAAISVHEKTKSTAAAETGGSRSDHSPGPVMPPAAPAHKNSPQLTIEFLIPVEGATDKARGESPEIIQRPAILPVERPGSDQSEAGSGATTGNFSGTKDSLNLITSRNGLCLEAGAAHMYGWRNGSGREADGFSPVAGFSYLSRLDKRKSVSFGLQYAMVPHLSSARRISRVTSFGFGEESKVTEITPVSLHYLVAPVRLYHFGARGHVFGGGINIAYLLNVDADVTTYDEQPGTTGNFETMRLSGYTEGFSWYDTQVSAFYRWDFARRFGVHAEVFLGLNDVKQDLFFRQAAKEKNTGLKVTLIYYTAFDPAK